MAHHLLSYLGMMTNAEIEHAWHEGNNAGEGFPACDCAVEDCGCDISDLDCGDHLLEIGSGDDRLVVYRDGDELIVVGDAHGPWAVRLVASTPATE